MQLVTAQQLLFIEPKIGSVRAAALAPLISNVCIRYGITTRYRLAAFLTTIIEETGGFTRYEENLNYTTASRIKQVWPSRFTLSSAAVYVRNPKGLASLVYANRLGNGSVASGDGYTYRGFGAIQITGKAMHQAYQKFANVNEQQMRSLEYYAIDSAAWYFVVYNKAVIPAADKADIVAVTKLVNGGLTNITLRVNYYNKALQAFK